MGKPKTDEKTKDKSMDSEELKKHSKMFAKMGMVKMVMELNLLKYPMIDFDTLMPPAEKGEKK